MLALRLSKRRAGFSHGPYRLLSAFRMYSGSVRTVVVRKFLARTIPNTAFILALALTRIRGWRYASITQAYPPKNCGQRRKADSIAFARCTIPRRPEKSRERSRLQSRLRLSPLGRQSCLSSFHAAVGGFFPRLLPSKAGIIPGDGGPNLIAFAII